MTSQEKGDVLINVTA